MAKIVAGHGHDPRAAAPHDRRAMAVARVADKARKHPFRDGVYGFDELVAMRKAEGLDDKSSMDAQHRYHARCDAAMEKLADKWDEVGADIAVILGNDQDEIYETDQLNPAFMVFFGEKIPNYPQTEEQTKKLAARHRGSRARPRDGNLHRIPGRARTRRAHHQDADGPRVRRRRLEGLAEARAQRRLARLRPHLPAGDARQGRAERADLSEHVLSAQPAEGGALLSIRPDRAARRSTPGRPTRRSRCSHPAA